jgi:hypothetical protein
MRAVRISERLFRFEGFDASHKRALAWKADRAYTGSHSMALEGIPVKGSPATSENANSEWIGEETLATQTRALETLNRVGAALSAELDLNKLVQIATDAGVELTGAQFGAFFYNVINEAGESYTLYTLSGAPRGAFAAFPMPRNTAVFGPTFRGEGIVRSEDITKDPRYGKNAPRRGMPEGHLPVRSYLAVPVISRSGEVHGGLFSATQKPACSRKEPSSSWQALRPRLR